MTQPLPPRRRDWLAIAAGITAAGFILLTAAIAVLVAVAT